MATTGQPVQGEAMAKTLQPRSSPAKMKVRRLPSSTAFCGNPCGLTDTSTESKSEDERRAVRRRLTLAIALSLIFMLMEIIGGVLSNSLAIMTDAAHLLSDVASFAISLFALWMAGWEATPRHSFGYHRMEIVGALISMQLIWMITGILLYEAVTRLMSEGVAVDGRLMFFTASFGVAVNVVLTLLLGHDHSHGGHDHGHGHGHDHGHSHSHDHGTGNSHKTGHSHSHSHSQSGSKSHSASTSHSHSHSSSNSHGHSHSHGHDHGVAVVHSHRQAHGDGSGRSQSGCRDSSSRSEPCMASTHKVWVASQGEDLEAPLLTSTGSESCICVLVPEEDRNGEHKKEGNINLKGAYLHVLGDLIQSIGVMIGGALIWYNPEWKALDLFCTLLFSAMVLGTTFTMLRDVMDVLMESTPRHINADEVLQGLLLLRGVVDVHELHIWAITLGKVVLACHVRILPSADADTVLQEVLAFCQTRYGITHATIQIETDCDQPLDS